jgi:hypothetical protein
MVAENRICQPSPATTEAPVPARTVAELLCDLGVVLRRHMRHGAKTERASLPPQPLGWERNLALGFVNLSASVQLRAMVEDWPLHRIQEAVRAQRLETLRAQGGYPTRLGPHRGADLENKRAGLRPPGLLLWLVACGFAAGLAAGIIGGLR